MIYTVCAPFFPRLEPWVRNLVAIVLYITSRRFMAGLCQGYGDTAVMAGQTEKVGGGGG